MTDVPTESRGRRLLRPTAFRIGLLAGLFTFLAVGGLIYFTIWLVERPDRLNVDVASRGADVSRHGGAKVVVATDDRGPLLTQTCNETCDDLRLQANSKGEDGLRIRVLDATGACIQCRGGGYVDSGLQTRIEIAGQGELQVRDVTRSSGTRSPAPTAPPAAK